nr:MAG: MipA/OmpV family protein [Hyphomicrobiales bacterium]
MRNFCTVVLGLCAVATSPSFAQGQPFDTSPEWEIRAGGGALFVPSFLGSKDYQLLALPNIEIAYGDVFEASVQRGVRYSVLQASDFAVGPVAKLDFGREEDGSRTFRVAGNTSDALLGLVDIGTTIELGGFAKYSQGPFTAFVELRQGVNGHKGLLGEAGVNYARRSSMLGVGTIFSIGPSVKFSNARYAQTFFGINAAQSLGSGLGVFAAEGGIHSYGIGSTAIFLLNERLSATLLGRYDRLVGDAKASPLVQERGSANQALVGVFLTYSLFK